VAGSGKKHCDEAIVAALAAGGNVAAAARHARVSERTVHRRLEDPAFRAKVDEARTELVRAVVGRLAAIGVLATTRLQNLVDNARSETVQLGAARAVLEFLFRGHEQDTLAREVAEVKRQLDEVRRGTGNVTGGPEADAGGPGDLEAGEAPALGQAGEGPGGRDDAGGPDAGPLAGGGPTVAG
jgi:hypothetical protein